MKQFLYIDRKRKRILGIKPGTWKLIQLAGIAFLIFVFISYIISRYENQPVHLLSPVAMNAYAETISAGASAQPKFPLADLPERERNIALIKKIWGHDASIALAIAKCESGYRSEATNDNTNGTQDQGVFQVNTVHQMPDMFNATANILYAHAIFIEQGTSPWDSSKHCWNK